MTVCSLWGGRCWGGCWGVLGGVGEVLGGFCSEGQVVF